MFKNKKIVVGAVLALLVAASSWGLDFYAGGNLGYGNRISSLGGIYSFSGFSLTPYAGIFPGPKKAFAVQLDLSMWMSSLKGDVFREYNFEDPKASTKAGTQFVFSPEIYAIYNFIKVPHVKPYIGAGIGFNFEKEFWVHDGTGGLYLNGKDVFSIGARAGINYNIPNTNVDVDLDLKLKQALPYTTEFDLCVGARYRFAKK